MSGIEMVTVPWDGKLSLYQDRLDRPKGWRAYGSSRLMAWAAFGVALLFPVEVEPEVAFELLDYDWEDLRPGKHSKELREAVKLAHGNWLTEGLEYGEDAQYAENYIIQQKRNYTKYQLAIGEISEKEAWRRAHGRKAQRNKDRFRRQRESRELC